MRTDLVPADEALAMVLEGAKPLGSERVPLKRAGGRVLAKPLAARRTQPPFAASAMDGYAVRAADTAGAPVDLRLVGESAAGRSWRGTLRAGQAVRIFTGAPVPKGADAIVIQENAEPLGNGPGTPKVRMLQAAPAGKHIRAAGLDFKKGETLLQRGEVLDPARLSLAASMNHDTLEVVRRPAIALLMTGDELVPPGSMVPKDSIISSNSFGLAALIGDAGGEAIDMGIARDTRKALASAFARALARKADVIVTTGGASVGDHDLVKPALADMGAKWRFEKIAMRPGKPFLFGHLRHKGRIVRLLGLAGNPVSCLIAGMRFLRPLVGLLAGRPAERLRPVQAFAGAALPANDEREDYLRASLTRRSDGALIATAFARQDSSMLATLARAECLLIRPAHAPALHEGNPCPVIVLRAV
jgi:molybdopterin molybdotransferase